MVVDIDLFFVFFEGEGFYNFYFVFLLDGNMLLCFFFLWSCLCLRVRILDCFVLMIFYGMRIFFGVDLL